LVDLPRHGSVASGRHHVWLGVELVDGEGAGRLRAVVVHDRSTEALERIETGGVFVMIGGEPPGPSPRWAGRAFRRVV
jgi:hypothetical protein